MPKEKKPGSVYHTVAEKGLWLISLLSLLQKSEWSSRSVSHCEHKYRGVTSFPALPDINDHVSGVKDSFQGMNLLLVDSMCMPCRSVRNLTAKPVEIGVNLVSSLPVANSPSTFPPTSCDLLHSRPHLPHVVLLEFGFQLPLVGFYSPSAFQLVLHPSQLLLVSRPCW